MARPIPRHPLLGQAGPRRSAGLVAPLPGAGDFSRIPRLGGEDRADRPLTGDNVGTDLAEAETTTAQARFRTRAA
ncbi:hypothetical protein JMM59_00290 [Rhodovulum sulfidophilum]|uniref:hypothetical protein n=1 Tax=Rhodovulum sulfidophilum TaxID=35806 RepID=UPI0019227258|nr:hypothetical protein [Rhodovulum sulfidophilum]MBL3563465.1 hypothetical protein [Rhodovulum sulfidophilum]